MVMTKRELVSRIRRIINIMNASLLNRLYSLSWLCMNCVLISRIICDWEWRWIELILINHWSVRSVDREWMDLFIRIMDWLMVSRWIELLGYESDYAINHWSQIVDVMNDTIRYVNWVFSDSWVSMCIGINETKGMRIRPRYSFFWWMIRDQ